MVDKVDNPSQEKHQLVAPKSLPKPASRMDSPARAPRSPQPKHQMGRHDRAQSPHTPRSPARTRKPSSPAPRTPVRVPDQAPCASVHTKKPISSPRSPGRISPTNQSKSPARSPRRAPLSPTRPKKPTDGPHSPERACRSPVQPSGGPHSPREKSTKRRNRDLGSSSRTTKSTGNPSSPVRVPQSPSGAPSSPLRQRRSDKSAARSKPSQSEKPLSPRSPRASITRVEEEVVAKQMTRPRRNGCQKQNDSSSLLDNKEVIRGEGHGSRRINEKVRTCAASGSKNSSRRSTGNPSLPGAVSVLNGVESQVTSKPSVKSSARQASADEPQELLSKPDQEQMSLATAGNSRRQSFEDALEAKRSAFDNAASSGSRNALEAGVVVESVKKATAANDFSMLHNSISDMEERVANKIRNEAKTATEAHQQIETLERQVLSIERLHSLEAKTPTAAQEQVDMLEQQVRAKERLFDNTGTNGTNMPREQVETLEQQVRAKAHLIDPPECDGHGQSSRSPHAEESPQQQSTSASQYLRCIEENVLTKAGPSCGRDHLEEFEHEVNAKTPDDRDDEQMEPKGEDDDDESLANPHHPDIEDGALKNGLAVAVPVEEDPIDNRFIPSAVEYDPEEKPSMYRNRRVRLYASLALFILALLGIGIGVGISLYEKNLHDPGVAFDQRENLGIREAVEKVVGTDVLVNESSPHATALRWITYHDPQKLTPSAPHFTQRYILAYFYFATSESRSWNACNPPRKDEADSCTFDRLDIIDPAIRNPTSSFRWLSAKPECNWAGLVCDQLGQIRTIDLAGFDLTGRFPVDVRHLPYLQSLSLASNKLSGPLPKEVASMRHMMFIEIHKNKFTGAIPQEWYKFQTVQNLNVAKNQFTGQLSSDLRMWTNMRKIYFQDNRLTGAIPTEFGELNNLSFIRLDSNSLKGTIPTELGNMSLLTVFQVQGNDLSGTIPTQLGQAGKLEVLRLQNNARLSGKIPSKLFSTVDTLEAYNCNLSGDLTEKFFLMEKMVTLRIHNNDFSGRLPPNLGKIMPGIAHLWISGNSFTGSIPDSICDLRGPFALNELIADCAPSGDRAVPEISCPAGCCSDCCDAAGENCLTANSN